MAAKQFLQDELDRAFKTAFGPATVARSEPATVQRLDEMVMVWDKLVRNMRRNQITFVVDRAHLGPILEVPTPHEGKRYEMNPVQASLVHQNWPMRLYCVLSADVAEFVPLSGLGIDFALKHLPQPPYDGNGSEV